MSTAHPKKKRYQHQAENMSHAAPNIAMMTNKPMC